MIRAQTTIPEVRAFLPTHTQKVEAEQCSKAIFSRGGFGTHLPVHHTTTSHSTPHSLEIEGGCVCVCVAGGCSKI